MFAFKKILVTGADGFIGSHLTEALVRSGYNVRTFVYYNSFNSWGWLDESPVEIKKSLTFLRGTFATRMVSRRRWRDATPC